MSVSLFSSVLSNTIISVKYVNQPSWRQKSHYAEEPQQTRLKKASIMEDVLAVEVKSRGNSDNKNTKYPGSYLIDTYA